MGRNDWSLDYRGLFDCSDHYGVAHLISRRQTLGLCGGFLWIGRSAYMVILLSYAFAWLIERLFFGTLHYSMGRIVTGVHLPLGCGHFGDLSWAESSVETWWGGLGG